jgi:hypothetical protein
MSNNINHLVPLKQGQDVRTIRPNVNAMQTSIVELKNQVANLRSPKHQAITHEELPWRIFWDAFEKKIKLSLGYMDVNVGGINFSVTNTVSSSQSEDPTVLDICDVKFEDNVWKIKLPDESGYTQRDCIAIYGSLNMYLTDSNKWVIRTYVNGVYTSGEAGTPIYNPYQDLYISDVGSIDQQKHALIGYVDFTDPIIKVISSYQPIKFDFTSLCLPKPGDVNIYLYYDSSSSDWSGKVVACDITGRVIGETDPVDMMTYEDIDLTLYGAGKWRGGKITSTSGNTYFNAVFQDLPEVIWVEYNRETFTWEDGDTGKFHYGKKEDFEEDRGFLVRKVLIAEKVIDDPNGIYCYYKKYTNGRIEIGGANVGEALPQVVDVERSPYTSHDASPGVSDVASREDHRHASNMPTGTVGDVLYFGLASEPEPTSKWRPINLKALIDAEIDDLGIEPLPDGSASQPHLRWDTTTHKWVKNLIVADPLAQNDILYSNEYSPGLFRWERLAGPSTTGKWLLMCTNGVFGWVEAADGVCY